MLKKPKRSWKAGSDETALPSLKGVLISFHTLICDFMKFMLPLLAVKDVEVSKKFYKEIFNQRVVCDYGRNVTFSGGFAIQEDFAWLIDVSPEDVIEKSNNMELYFETDDLDSFINKLEKYPIEYVHKMRTHDWKQRVIRIYDPDHHIIEVGEPMDAVVKRCLKEGYSPEETAEITQQTVEFVQRCVKQLAEMP